MAKSKARIVIDSFYSEKIVGYVQSSPRSEPKPRWKRYKVFHWLLKNGEKTIAKSEDFFDDEESTRESAIYAKYLMAGAEIESK